MPTAAPIVVSGGEVPKGLCSRFQLPAKSLIPCMGKTLLAHSIAALLDSQLATKPIAVVGPEGIRAELAQFGESVAWLNCSDNLMDNAAIGMRFYGEGKNLLLLSPDLPTVTGATIDAFLSATPPEAEIAVPLITREQFLRRYPDAPNKFLRTVDGEVTMGSAFFITSRALKMNIPLGRDAYQARKSPWKLAILAGLTVSYQMLSGKLRISSLERRISRLCDAQVRAVRVDAPELAYDADCCENIDYIERCGG
jgi:GTP:adenosylcobinamide-phosphate guanylyltransferase